jgi:hypothetical protein
MNKKLKTVNIKGKEYVMVHERILAFHEAYENGSIETEYFQDGATWVVKATVRPDANNEARKFIGHAQEVEGDGFINKTSALENAETSAVGRALGMLGIGIIEGMASADEVKKAQNRKTLDVNDSVFIKTKWVSDEGERKKINAGIKSIGGQWIPEKKVWAIHKDKQTEIPAECLKGIEAILDKNGEVLPFTVDVEIDPKPF